MVRCSGWVWTSPLLTPALPFYSAQDQLLDEQNMVRIEKGWLCDSVATSRDKKDESLDLSNKEDYLKYYREHFASIGTEKSKIPGSNLCHAYFSFFRS